MSAIVIVEIAGDRRSTIGGNSKVIRTWLPITGARPVIVIGPGLGMRTTISMRPGDAPYGMIKQPSPGNSTVRTTGSPGGRPATSTGLPFSSSISTVNAVDWAARTGSESLNILSAKLLEAPWLAAEAHERGLGIKVFRVDERAEFLQVLELGVDGVFTSRPQEFLELLQGGGGA